MSFKTVSGNYFHYPFRIITTASRYFNIYIYHVAVVLAVMGVLLFKMMEQFDVFTLGEYFAFIFMLLFPCVFSQHLTNNVSYQVFIVLIPNDHLDNSLAG